MASPSTAVTQGYGTFGAAALLVTQGYGINSIVVVLDNRDATGRGSGVATATGRASGNATATGRSSGGVIATGRGPNV
jgi:hypothetical protein